MTNRLKYFAGSSLAMKLLLAQENYLNGQFSAASILIRVG
jgi:hypothetical protein